MECIPIMHCFNQEYVIPAAVSFYSMISNASKKYEYKLYVLHDDISLTDQKRLQIIVDQFSNATIEFMDMKGKFSDLYAMVGKRVLYSKEMFYKLLAPTVFNQYHKIIITDVDVVFLGDVSVEYEKFRIEAGEEDEEIYLAGQIPLEKKRIVPRRDGWTQEECNKLLTGGGYWIFNLKKMREDNKEKEFVQFAYSNVKRLWFPEQDVVNSCCYPRIKFLPPSSLIRNFEYEKYENGSLPVEGGFYSKEEIKEALDNVVQLHFSGNNFKPWDHILTAKFDVWLKYLKMTSYYVDWLENIQSAIDHYDNSTMEISIPFRGRKLGISLFGYRAKRKTKMLCIDNSNKDL